MSKLTLEEIVPYLPYKLKVIHKVKLDVVKQMGLRWSTQHEAISDILDSKWYKPILRPLSDLTEEEYYRLSGKDKDKSFSFFFVQPKSNKPYMYIQGYSSKTIYINEFDRLPLFVYNFCIKHHFDINSLIGQNKAIDINTIQH